MPSAIRGPFPLIAILMGLANVGATHSCFFLPQALRPPRPKFLVLIATFTSDGTNVEVVRPLVRVTSAALRCDASI